MEDANQKKKMILYGIVATVAVFLVVLVLLIVLMAQESNKTKVVFGGKIYKTRTVDMTAEDGNMYQQKNITFENKEVPILLNTSSGETYYCIETLATMAGYKYNKGAYGELDENTNKCYIDNGGEYVTFSTETESISKNIKISERYTDELEGKERIKNSALGSNTETEDEEVFSLEKPVIKFADGKLYASYDAITQGFNMSVIANGSDVTIYTLENLVATYNDFLNSKGYTLTKNFRNQRALYKGLAVAKKNEEYGVVELSGDGYQEVISVKYDTVEYVQSIGEFVISSNSMYGMISPGEEKPTISLKYDSIQLLDAQKKLYIVETDKKFGVVNAKGDVIIPTEYDQIGLDDISIYKSQGIKSKYLIADDCIPVVKNNTYGLFNTEGYTTVNTSRNYVTLGCVEPAKIIDNTAAMPTLTVPLSNDLTCIVYGMDRGGENAYGIMTTDGSPVTQAYYEAIYYMNLNGKTTYYFNKASNNELITLEELTSRPAVKSLIANASAKKKTKEQLEKDTKQEQNDMENLNSGDSSETENAINDAKRELQNALTMISDEYYANELQEPLVNYVTVENLVQFVGEYKIIDVPREDGIKIIFEDDNYKYEAYINDELEISDIKII